MGASPYWYTVKYNADVEQALLDLREREYKAGRYNPVIRQPEFPVTATSRAPGARHPTIEAALEAADADGTRSILDLDHISEEPDYGAVTRLSDEVVLDLFGTATPTRQHFDECDDFWEIEAFDERGQGVYFFLYENGKPSEIVFAGYSFD